MRPEAAVNYWLGWLAEFEVGVSVSVAKLTTNVLVCLVVSDFAFGSVELVGHPLFSLSL